MKCQRCGSELEENARFCHNCGYDNGMAGGQSIVPPQSTGMEHQKKKSPLWKKIVFGVGIFAIIVLVLGFISGFNAGTTIEKLKDFTTLEKNGEKYEFLYKDEWALVYTEEDKYVRFDDADVEEIMEDCFGVLCFPSEEYGSFKYNLEDNTIEIDLDVYSENDGDVTGGSGHITALVYNMESKEYRCIVDNQECTITSKLGEYLSKSGVTDIMMKYGNCSGLTRPEKIFCTKQRIFLTLF